MLHSKRVLHEGSNSKRIDVIVFDVYKKNSTNAEQEKRGAEFRTEFRNLIQSQHKVRQCRELLLHPKNKRAFIEFVVGECGRDN